MATAEIGENLTLEPEHLKTCVIPLLTLIAPCRVILTLDDHFRVQHKNHQHHRTEIL